MRPIAFHVLGMMPVTTGNQNEEGWRQQVADKSRLFLKKVRNEKIDDNTRFTVELTFFLSPERLRDSAVENLARPVITSLFGDAPPTNYKSERLFNQPATHIASLHIKKTMLDQYDSENQNTVGVWIAIDW